MLTTTEPIGTVLNRTGDLRPEPVLDGGGSVAVFASQDVAPGRRSRLAQVTPLAWVDEATLADFAAAQPFADVNRRVVEAISDPGSLVRAGRVVTLTGAGTGASTAPRTFTLSMVDGEEPVRPAPSFTATVNPKLLDFDPASGRASWRSTRNSTALREEHASTGSCASDRPVRPCSPSRFGAAAKRSAPPSSRTDPTPTTRSTLVCGSTGASSAFGAGSRRRAVADVGAGNLDSAWHVRRTLPVLGTGTTPIHSLMAPESVVLADGSRWLALGAGVPGKRDTLEKILVRQSP